MTYLSTWLRKHSEGIYLEDLEMNTYVLRITAEVNKNMKQTPFSATTIDEGMKV